MTYLIGKIPSCEAKGPNNVNVFAALSTTRLTVPNGLYTTIYSYADAKSYPSSVLKKKHQSMTFGDHGILRVEIPSKNEFWRSWNGKFYLFIYFFFFFCAGKVKDLLREKW